jgi:hypothetical protein
VRGSIATTLPSRAPLPARDRRQSVAFLTGVAGDAHLSFASPDRAVVLEFDPAQPLAVDPHVSKHVRRERLVGIEAADFRQEVDPRELSQPNPVGGGVVDLPRDPREGLVGRELRQDLARGNAEDRRELASLAGGIRDLFGHGERRKGFHGDRQLAVRAVEDRAAAGREPDRALLLPPGARLVGRPPNDLHLREPESHGGPPEPEKDPEGGEPFRRNAVHGFAAFETK